MAQAWTQYEQSAQSGQTPRQAASTLGAARSESGYRWRVGSDGRYESVEGGRGAAGNAFRQAAIRDGQSRVSTYSDRNWEEYFAESFSLYITDPETLEQFRPNQYRYFVQNHPR